VDYIELQGKHLKEALEFSVNTSYSRYRGNGRHKRDLESRVFSGQAFIQFSGKSPNVLNTMKQKA